MISKKDIFSKGIVLALKVGSMGIKFLFFSIYLPKEMSVATYGDLGLLMSTITIFIFVVGFDFYNFSHRDFITDEKEVIANKLTNQFIFNCLLFLLSAPLFYLLGYYSELPAIGIAIILLFTEYFGQELYRLLVVFSKPILANVLLFFRSSMWILALLGLSNLGYATVDIETILVYWIIGNAVLFFLTMIYSLTHPSFVLKNIKLNISWLKQGFIISIPFFLSTISLKIIEFSDRYIINIFYSKFEVGIYAFYSNIANSLNVFISTSVVIMIYPKILKAMKNKELEKAKQLVKVYKKEMFLFLLLFSVLIVVLIYPVLSWVGKEEYGSEMLTLWVLLIANILFNVSLIPHVILYTLHRDKELIKPVIWACILNLFANFGLVPFFGILGAATATLISFAVVVGLKFFYAKKTELL